MSHPGKLIAFRHDQPPAQVVERFAGSQLAVEALWRNSEEFREICRDYREARASLDRAEAGPASAGARTVKELHGLVRELEDEMTALLLREIPDSQHA